VVAVVGEQRVVGVDDAAGLIDAATWVVECDGRVVEADRARSDEHAAADGGRPVRAGGAGGAGETRRADGAVWAGDAGRGLEDAGTAEAAEAARPAPRRERGAGPVGRDAAARAARAGAAAEPRQCEVVGDRGVVHRQG